LTDCGLIDPYLAMMKGVILSINRDAVIVDVSHSIMTGRIAQAADMVRDTYLYFPKGTVHVAVVDPGVGSDRRRLCIEAHGHFFVGPDNGIFWPVIKDTDATVIQLAEDSMYFLPHVTSTFHGREVFAPVAAHLSLGNDIHGMGAPIQDPVEIGMPLPHVINGILYGEIMHIDNFGNIITNITKKTLEDFLQDSGPIISIGDLDIRRIDNIYFDVEEGAPLALINSSGRLEIAVNLGRASEYTGIHRDQIIGNVVSVSRCL